MNIHTYIHLFPFPPVFMWSLRHELDYTPFFSSFDHESEQELKWENLAKFGGRGAEETSSDEGRVEMRGEALHRMEVRGFLRWWREGLDSR